MDKNIEEKLVLCQADFYDYLDYLDTLKKDAVKKQIAGEEVIRFISIPGI